VQFEVCNPLDWPDWNDRLAALGDVSFFNTAEWAGVLASTYGYTPCYRVGVEGGDWVCLLPMMQVASWMTGRRGVSLPFSDYCEPLGLDGGRGRLVIDDLKSFGREHQWRYFEIRNAAEFGEQIPHYAKYLKHTLNLAEGEFSLNARLKGSVRTSIRKARKAGVDISFSNTMDAVRGFYDLHCRTRRRHGWPPQPFAFFQQLHRQILTKGLGMVVAARYEGRLIAASLFCHAGKRAIFKYGAADLRWQHLRAATLIMWEAIRRYIEDGFQQLSMGRTDLANAGLRRFKLGWGAEETEVAYFRYDLLHGRFLPGGRARSEAGFGFMKRVPVSCLRVIGSMLYKHIA
jgi:hypothetical protein